MEKINCIEDYFSGVYAYYLFHLGNYLDKSEYLDYILDKRYLNAAKVSFVSNIMLGIKEELVDTKGAMDYQSKLFLNSLENSVSYIATKVDNGYKLGNYMFPNAATLVAILRNKLAHGKYKFDFDHNRVILEHKGVDIIINIDKLVGFVMLGFRNKIRDVKRDVHERNIVYIIRKTSNIENNIRIRDENDLRRIIKSYNCVNYKIVSLNGMNVMQDCIMYLDNFLNSFDGNPYVAMKSDYYKNLCEYLERRNCKLVVEYKKLDDDEQIDRIIKHANVEIINNDSLSYENKLKLIALEVQRSVDCKFNNFNAMAANIYNLILLDSISKTNSVNRDVISNYIGKYYPYDVKYGYDEYGMLLLGLFNSLFMYPFDDVFETSGEYKLNRDDSFDFSKLDLSMVNPIVVNIDESYLNNLLDRCNSLVKKQGEISQKLVVQQGNLSRVTGNLVAEGKIKSNISDLKNSLVLLMTEYIKVDGEYNLVKNDFTVNRLHFENRAIIEGIRNAIAHGNYEFISNGELYDTKIIFNDIYDGDNTFQLVISFEDFEGMIADNYEIVLDYVRNKISGKGILSK